LLEEVSKWFLKKSLEHSSPGAIAEVLVRSWSKAIYCNFSTAITNYLLAEIICIWIVTKGLEKA
jgi:hypothetical protein